ncbi:MAG: SGNH/GDSL hydrolase family protein [Actinomycetota bacterium]|nr:SGNH/GDSL hydrolase family protein [Actinomycetota bacterium]
MRRILTAAVLGCVLASVAACSSNPPKPAADPVDTVPFADYVALGDSFTAGPFIAPAIKGSPTTCFRSGGNYPSYLASYLKVKTLRDVSCAGATTDDLYSSQSKRVGLKPDPKTDVPPQLIALTKSTDLVTLGIGGNDFALFQNLILASIGRRDIDTRLAFAAQVQSHVEDAIIAIRERAPHAKIVIVGYLRVFPETGACPTLPLADSDRKQADSIERRLNRSLEQAADEKKIAYVDAYSLGTGHEVCAGKEAYVNGSKSTLFVAAAFHPFRRGMDAVAREAYSTLVDEPAPKTPSLKKLAAVPR